MARKTPEQLYKELRLTDRLKKLANWRHLDSAEARAELGFGTSGKEMDKYLSRPRSAGERWINTTPGALKANDHVAVVEGPKALWAVTAYFERAGVRNVKVIDLNGLPGWLVKSSDDEPGHPNPDLLLLVGHRVTTVFDSNSFREDLKPLMEGVNGPDDLLGQKNGDRLFQKAWESRQPLWHYECPAVSDFDPNDIKSDLLIEHLIANQSITLFASPSENYKTMIAMCLSRSLLNKENAFECDQFVVNKTVPGVLYLCPDMSHELTILYASKFGLHDQSLAGRFRIRTMKQGELLTPDHPVVIAAAKAGWFIVMDTMNYFTLADDDNNPQQLNKFIVKVRRLVDTHGASGVLMLVHPTKTGARNNDVEVTEWVSGTYAKIGSVDTIFCMRKIKDDGGTPLDVWVSREKSRPFLGVRLEPFTLMLLDEKGKSTIDAGRLPVRKLKAGDLKDYLPKKNKGGAPSHPQKPQMMTFIRGYLKANKGKKDKLGRMEILRALDSHPPFNPPDPKTGLKTGCGVTDRTIGNWLDEIKKDKRNVEEIAA